MFIETLIETIGRERRFENAPDWSAIRAAIERLDGERYTLVTLEHDEETQMCIGGGANGNYLGFINRPGPEVFNLISDRKEGDKITMVAGGQLGDYDLRSCVTRAEALAAAQRFALDGEREQSLKWEEA